MSRTTRRCTARLAGRLTDGGDFRTHLADLLDEAHWTSLCRQFLLV
jgi:hypothetical protein